MEFSRRSLLIGGGAGAGLLIAYALWPRSYAPNLRAAPGEAIFNAFLKIGVDGRVTVVVPQAEMGQGVYTALPQIVADELGADWRTVSVEPAPIGPLYANGLLAAELSSDWIGGKAGTAAAHEYARRNALMLTGGSTSVRAFEPRLRDAGAAGRVLLCKAAARRWDIAWEACDTNAGFVTSNAGRLRFGELADEASSIDLPDPVPRRAPGTGKLAGRPLPRLDVPAKVDGSARFAADVRLSGLVYAAIRQGPPGEALLAHVDKAAARQVTGLIAIVEQPRWVAAVATNWWAAERAVEALAARFEAEGALADDRAIEEGLAGALRDGEATRFHEAGDSEAALSSGAVFGASYYAAAAPHAAIETLTATARFTGDRLEVWAPTQAQSFARAAAARAGGLSDVRVTLYPMLVGGGFGRNVEVTAIEQAVVIAKVVRRPVQLIWSRLEDLRHDTVRPPVHGRLTARIGPGGTLVGWNTRIAVPAAFAETAARLTDAAAGPASAEAAAVEGAVPPYAIPAVAVDHVPAQVGVASGVWRSRAHSYTAFFTESFIDELARKAGVEPLGFRIQMLGRNPRLARVLSAAAALGGWDGGASGSTMGIAAHAMAGSYAAMVADVRIDNAQRVRVTRISAAIDIGRTINPDLVRQQIEGGILWGIAAATGTQSAYQGGLPAARTLGALRLGRLADAPDLRIELLPSGEPPGGAEEIAVPPVAPAIANALFAATGQRLRALPLSIGGR